jgi:two-component sensor histidine kinase/PAS domain-containing protein
VCAAVVFENWIDCHHVIWNQLASNFISLRMFKRWGLRLTKFISTTDASFATPPASETRHSDIELLHGISTELIGETDVPALYSKILDAAVAIMGSQFASMQTLDTDRERLSGQGELHLLSARGYTDEAIRKFEWVSSHMKTSCGVSLRTGRRTIISDVERCDDLSGSEELAAFLQTGIRAMQTTPLISRSGQLLGMITTHWAHPHEPSTRDLRLMDILARQAADLLERTKAEAALQARERQLEGILGAVTDAFMSVDCDFRLAFINDCFASRFDKEPSELLGQRLWDLLPFSVDSATHRELSRAMRERVVVEFEVYYAPWGRWFSKKACPTADGGLAVYSQDITERKLAEELRQTLTSELSHRVKNMLATVQAIATQTLRRSRNSADFVKSFSGRIQSMSLVHSQLSTNEWKGTQLRDVVLEQVQLGPIDETRVSATGPDVRLDARIVPHVAMMIHELGTNSIKYGALSNASGTVSITWSVRQNSLSMVWKEEGGPVVAAPVKAGLGTKLIEQSARGAGGTAHMTVKGTGVTWDIEFQLPDPAEGLMSSAVRANASQRLAGVARPQTTNSQPLRGQRFLIVEDEPLVAMEIVDLIESVGGQVVGPTANAAEALKLIEDESIDAALLDANLYGSPVDDIAAALTRNDTPFVFVTGYDRDSLPRAFQSAAVLQKPFTSQQLIDSAAKLARSPQDIVVPLTLGKRV